MPSTSHRLALTAGVVMVAAVLAGVAGATTGGPTSPDPAVETALPTWEAQPELPVEVEGDLWVGGEQVPGEWGAVEGRGTRWIASRLDRTWWWGNGPRPQRMEGEVDQAPAISASGRYLAHVVGGGRQWTVVAIDTEHGDELGRVQLPHRRMSPAPRAVAVTDDGLIVVGGPFFQWVWRPLAGGGTLDLAETAPGQAVVGSTDAGLVVNEGRYDRTDGQQGAPYLARLAEDGTLIRLGPLPTHDVLEASDEWLAYALPGTLGGEVWGTPELQVQRPDGSDEGVVTAPDGWRFTASNTQWESADELLVVLVSRDGDEALARCRPDRMTCARVDPPD